MPNDVYPNYPRAEHHLPDGDPVGRDTMMALTGRTRNAVAKWIEREELPLADGPFVNGGPTWKRRTFLAWAYDREFLPSGLVPEGRRWFEQVGPYGLVAVKVLRERAQVPPSAGGSTLA